MKTIFSPKYAKPLFCLMVIYVIVIITWVFIDDGFYGLRWLSVLNFLIILPFWLWLVYYDRRHQHEQELKRSHIHSLYLILAFFIIIPLCNHLPQKVAILFYDIDKWVNELQIMEVVVEGSNGKSLNRFSGGSLGTIVKNPNNTLDEHIIVCNLIVKIHCSYDNKILPIGEKVVVHYKYGNLYPFKYRTLVFSMKSKNINKDIQYHLKLYRKNKKYVIIYLIFIQLANLFFALVSYRILWLYITQKTNP